MLRLDALVTGLVISAVSAWYSILGLITIFSAAFWPVLVMGTVLEIGKVVTASWLYRNWKEIPTVMRAYFSLAVIVLMMITSIGIFGYLSNAHVSGTIESGDDKAKVAFIDDEIATQIAAEAVAIKQLKQLDSAVDKLIEMDQVTKSVQLRQQQTKDRDTFRSEVKRAQTAISSLRIEKSQAATSIRRAEAEAGPIRYISALVYGESSTDSMERAVRLVIVLLVFAFDPLAILLIMAASYRPKDVDLPTGSVAAATKFDSLGRIAGSANVFIPTTKKKKLTSKIT